MSLWGGRFQTGPSELFKHFNDSLPFDYRLVEQDILGSIAWAGGLRQVGVLTADENEALVGALSELHGAVLENPKLPLASDAEDVHTWVEIQLIEMVGDLGKKLHTGRSRNDQVATDLKLWCKSQVSLLGNALMELINQLVDVADQYDDVVMPGYTHLQRAQPILFSHWCLAYVEMLTRDHSRIHDLIKRLDTCPLGCGALAGTTYEIDREALAKHLGFARATRNSLDTVSDRDHVVELMSVASLGMVHLSRMAEDLIFYNSGEAGFIELSDQVTSGSSLMPQKKNPDGLELIRGKSGRVFGGLTAILSTLKALPLAYNKDMQEDKEGLFDALPTWLNCLQMARLCLVDIKLNRERMARAAQGGYANSTELADYLVARGIPFREAHHISGQLVQVASAQQLPLEELPLAEFQKVSADIEQDVYAVLPLKICLEKRAALGGTSLERVHQAIKDARMNAAFKVRHATLQDVDAIEQLVSHWYQQGENLPRDRKDIVHSINEFAVTEENGLVTGCASLYIYDTGLAEIRSVGVSPDSSSKGQGGSLVRFMLDRAYELSIDRTFVLTRVPGFFAKMGFDFSHKDALPEKVMKDCEYCLRKDNCDEVAMDINFHQREQLIASSRG